jgi:hypothetical protein
VTRAVLRGSKPDCPGGSESAEGGEEVAVATGLAASRGRTYMTVEIKGSALVTLGFDAFDVGAWLVILWPCISYFRFSKPEGYMDTMTKTGMEVLAVLWGL